MLNLLPEEHKKKIIGEYTKRVWTVVLVGIIIVSIISGVFLLPVYLMTYGRYSEAAKEKANLEVLIAESQKNSKQEVIKDIYGVIATLDTFKPFALPGALVQALVLDRVSGISINHIIYTPSAGQPPVIDVVGKASTRNSLMAFSEKLKADGAFSSVYIPISDFTQEKNITFSLKLIASTTPAQ
jgi:hypothetical protein